jgi:hypothetical protein
MKLDRVDGISITEGRRISRRFPIDLNAEFCGDRKGSGLLPKGDPERWNCTRAKNHEGPHVAHTPEGIVAALWHDEPDALEAKDAGIGPDKDGGGYF